VSERERAPGDAPRCRCRGPIPYAEAGGDRTCAKCGHALECLELAVLSPVPSEGEDRIGNAAPDPCPESAASLSRSQRARPASADSPPASHLVSQASSGPILDWPFHRAASSASPKRP
jgi:hypothetical protein